MSNNYFQQVNNYLLGDVVQSIEEIDGNNYIVVNNSGKIEIVDTSNFVSNGNISGFVSPREIKRVKSNTAYVSDLYSNSIYVVDLVSKVISSSIPVSGWTESIMVYDTIAMVSCPGSNVVYKINTNTHQIVDSISTSESPMNLVFDKNNKLWVLCAGSWGTASSTLERIDVSAGVIEQTVPLNSTASKLCANSSADILYWIDGGVKQMSVDQVGVFNSIISSGTGYYYGLGVHPQTDEIYITDAVDFVQSGWLYRYNNSGGLIDSVNTGINPQAIYFR